MGWGSRRRWDEPPEEEIQEECSCGKCRWDTFDPYDFPPAAVADYLSSQIKKQIQED